MAPYNDWDSFVIEAKKIWSLYKKTAKPTKITRIAVRYINKIDLPLPVKDFKDYLRTYPEVSTDLPQELSSFFIQLQIPLSDIKSTLILTQTIVEPTKKDVVSIVLDIDIFRIDAVPQEDSNMWKTFEVFRQKKNMIFESCITDKTQELFK